MIQSTRNWFKRNRTKFAIGAGVLGAGYVATQYVLGKVRETRERMGDERIAKENLRRRFEQNQEDCTFTVLAILPTATENIIEALPVERALAELQREKAERLARSVGASEVSTADLPSAPQSVANGADDTQSGSFVLAQGSDGSESAKGDNATAGKSRRSKVQLWNEIKIQSIARAFTLVYTLALLTLLTRIQLNLLGRRNYLASVVSLAAPPKRADAERITLQNNDDDGLENAYSNDFDTNRKYLSFSWWLLHRGCRDILEKVQQAVKEIFGPVSPREDVSLQKLSELVVLIRKRVEGFTEEERRNTKWLPYLLPPPEQEDYVLRASGMLDDNTAPQPSSDHLSSTNPFLRRLLDETADLADSPAFSHVLTQLLDSGFTQLIDGKIAALAYKIPPISASAARAHELVAPGEARAKLANTLAVFCRQAHAIGSGAANEYLEAMERVRDLEAFAAVVYSSNFEAEAPAAAAQGGGGGGVALMDGFKSAVAASEAAPQQQEGKSGGPVRPPTPADEASTEAEAEVARERSSAAQEQRANEQADPLPPPLPPRYGIASSSIGGDGERWRSRAAPRRAAAAAARADHNGRL